jgi:alpha-tubulin suppressor-like RCC1 family protein
VLAGAWFGVLLFLASAVQPASAQIAIDVSPGVFHTCGVSTVGGVKCWGGNASGELGDGTLAPSLTPVDVTGLTSGVAAVDAGIKHTCAVTTAGGIKCWGLNLSGELGDGTVVNKNTPVDVTGLTIGVAAVDAGQGHTCAVTTLGSVKCWGNNTFGKLGDGTVANKNTPVDVTGLTIGGAAVAAGETYTCALTTAGGVKCWGSNIFGQLGDGTVADSTTPVDVLGFGVTR